MTAENEELENLANPDVIRDINRRLAVGMTKEEFERDKNVKLSTYNTLEDVVHNNLRQNLMRLIDDKFTITSCLTRINISAKQQQMLLEKAEKNGQTVSQTIGEILDQHLVTKPDEGQ